MSDELDEMNDLVRAQAGHDAFATPSQPADELREAKLTLKEAKRQNRCRICGGFIYNELNRMIDDLVLNHGKEYAHMRCTQKQQPTREDEFKQVVLDLRNAIFEEIEKHGCTPVSKATVYAYMLRELQPLFEHQQERLKHALEYRALDIEARKEIARLKAEVDGLRDEREAITKHMEHMALDEMPDGRRIRDNKIPWEQFVCMVMNYYKAEVERLKGEVMDFDQDASRQRDKAKHFQAENDEIRDQCNLMRKDYERLRKALEEAIAWYGKGDGDEPPAWTKALRGESENPGKEVQFGR